MYFGFGKISKYLLSRFHYGEGVGVGGWVGEVSGKGHAARNLGSEPPYPPPSCYMPLTGVERDGVALARGGGVAARALCC